MLISFSYYHITPFHCRSSYRVLADRCSYLSLAPEGDTPPGPLPAVPPESPTTTAATDCSSDADALRFIRFIARSALIGEGGERRRDKEREGERRREKERQGETRREKERKGEKCIIEELMDIIVINHSLCP